MTPNAKSQSQDQQNPEPANENVLTQILATIQSLAQSSAATQNAVLEAAQRLPVAPVVGGSGASSSASGSGSVPPRVRDGKQGARNDVPPSMVRKIFH